MVTHLGLAAKKRALWFCKPVLLDLMRLTVAEEHCVLLPADCSPLPVVHKVIQECLTELIVVFLQGIMSAQGIT